MSKPQTKAENMEIDIKARRVAAIAGKPLNPQPRTLTGDDWRAAWAEARDREADKALDAVY